MSQRSSAYNETKICLTGDVQVGVSLGEFVLFAFGKKEEVSDVESPSLDKASASSFTPPVPQLLRCFNSSLGWTLGLGGKILIFSKVLAASDFSLRHHRTKSQVPLLGENTESVLCN